MACYATVSGAPDMSESEVSLKVGALYEVTDRTTVFALPPGKEEQVYESSQTLYGAAHAKAIVLPVGTLAMCIAVRLVDGCWILDVGGEWMLSDGTGLTLVGES